ncbi:alpha-amylase family glycosyl hydrolase [Sphingomonas donggukensis]|uniref:Alpha-amylase family glycosyl hydrolase n=1 Tax=Sphingomonas donggukensis TaxID=2949093 RepID=A0ABY4TW69_9SPHN|nr:alpha-amylase family glycosyl hydrolase [Sphingomonas donggukensis]URW76194.1 alpha-amylase family glycosyl hydrolase [Sphingomonas donggukensis]
MTDPQRVPATAPTREWWRGAAIYQIYPRSFADSNGDGIGDLPGITGHLDYVAALGVDAIWLSPFFTSPMKDFGYDVADYCGVDPIFGTLDDFDALVARAHDLRLKVIVDQVYSHTSDEHPWFTESRASRTNARADWYVWADAKADGAPPNNWQSVFGGPAWTWDARRGQYYLHNFLSSQPQLNGHNPDVQAALLNVARFWLDRGVDGFRVDAINFAMHDPALTDNPPAPTGNGVRTRPFDFQLHVHNQSHPDIPLFLERLRALLDSYGGKFTVAEVGGADSDREMKAFTSDRRRLDSAYGFDFLYAAELNPKVVAEAVENWPDTPGTGWPSWAFENHDAPRAISRWAAPDQREAFAAVKMLLLVCLRGSIILYYGEELGLTQVDVPFESLQDPEAIANWPLTLSRDGARTPMPWRSDAAGLGFSGATPWLPTGPDHAALAVDVQQGDAGSMLALTRRLLAFRNTNDALLTGGITVRVATDTLLVFERASADEVLLCAFNLGSEAADCTPAQPGRWRVVEQVGTVDRWNLAGLSGLVARRMA